MSTLILFLPPARPGPASEYAYTLTADGHSALQHATAPAALLPEPTRPGGEVVAVVPARALSWQRVTMPAGVPLGAGQQTPRLRSVLEGLACRLAAERMRPAEVEELLRGRFGAEVFEGVIRANTHHKAAPSHRKTIFEHEPEGGRGREDYEALTSEVMSRLGLIGVRRKPLARRASPAPATKAKRQAG